ADGTVFPYVFNFPVTYWSEASVLIQYIANKEGGLERLRGKRIALLYHNSPYGKEPIPPLEGLRDQYGYELAELAVDHPGTDQSAAWQQVRRVRPDWILLWGWGAMTSAALMEAAAMNYPMDRILGVWWSGAEPDVMAAGESARGYLAGAFHPPG